MKLVYLSLTLSLFSIASYAQKTTIKWGEEFKLEKSSLTLKTILVDENSVFMEEIHLSSLIPTRGLRELPSLIKLDKNLSEIYRKGFKKELGSKDFRQFFAIDDKLFMIAAEYSKQDQTLFRYAAAIDKQSGEMIGDWKELASYRQHDKSDYFNVRFTYNTDSTRMVIVCSTKGKEREEYNLQEFDKNLQATAKPVIISNEFELKKYQLEDVLYTPDQKVVLVGRIYEYETGKKKKNKFLDFTNYNIRIYDTQGKQQSEINTSINGKWLMSTKMAQEKNKDLALAAFYSNEKKGKTIDGILVQRINVATGKVISTSENHIDNSLLSASYDDENIDEEDKKAESRKDKSTRESRNKQDEDPEGFSKTMIFRNIFHTTDNGLIILAEDYEQYTFSVASNPRQFSNDTRHMYHAGNLMMCKIDASGNIAWIRSIPKSQREVSVEYGGGGGIISFSFFVIEDRPFYSGFGAIQAGNTIQVLFNDHPDNANITQASQQPKGIFRLDKSDCFVLNVDETTGKFTRKVLFSNNDTPISMPRLGVVFGNDMYMIGKTIRAVSKSRVAVAKITVAE